jgi:hypothetical protein
MMAGHACMSISASYTQHPKTKKRNDWKDEAAEERRREGYMSMDDEIIMREMIAMYNELA